MVARHRRSERHDARSGASYGSLFEKVHFALLAFQAGCCLDCCYCVCVTVEHSKRSIASRTYVL